MSFGPSLNSVPVPARMVDVHLDKRLVAIFSPLPDNRAETGRECGVYKNVEFLPDIRSTH